MYRDIPEDLRERIEPVVEAHDCELVDIEVQQGHGAGLVRVIVDTPSGDGRVAVEQCAGISREVGSELDAGDLVSGSYRLEVSSPGLDRLLAREKDFVSACGQEVKLQTRRPVAGRRRFRGELVAFEDQQLRLAVDGEEIAIPFAEIKRANTVYKFSRADFAGQRTD